MQARHGAMHVSSPRRLLDDTQQVLPWMLGRPVPGVDGRLVNHLGSPFQHQPSLLFLGYAVRFGTKACYVLREIISISDKQK